MSKHSVYAWKAQYDGWDVNETQRVWQIEDENQRLKELVADLGLDKGMLKAVIAKTTGVRRALGGRALALRPFESGDRCHRIIFTASCSYEPY